MAGRGLRTVDPELYPGVTKKDCIILDFGTSILIHGNLDSADGMHAEKNPDEKGEAVTKVCPAVYRPGMVYRFPDVDGNIGCGAEIPARCKTCPLCGFVFERLDGENPLEEVSLMEMDIIGRSPFKWVSLFGSENLMMASGFAAWAGVFSVDGDTWHALGKLALDKKVHRLAVTGRPQALASADDFLRQYETDANSRKSKQWLDQPASEKQLGLLRSLGYDAQADPLGRSAFSKYSASCHSNFSFSRYQIEKALGV